MRNEYGKREALDAQVADLERRLSTVPEDFEDSLQDVVTAAKDVGLHPGDWECTRLRTARAALTEKIAALQFRLPSWVNADDRKPDESTHVLATFKNGDYEIMWFEAGDWWGTDRGDEPTHWMPLPEPPK